MTEPTDNQEIEAAELAVRGLQGSVAHVVATDPAALRELHDLCARWHRKRPNSLYVDWQQSLLSYLVE